MCNHHHHTDNWLFWDNTINAECKLADCNSWEDVNESLLDSDTDSPGWLGTDSLLDSDTDSPGWLGTDSPVWLDRSGADCVRPSGNLPLWHYTTTTHASNQWSFYQVGSTTLRTKSTNSSVITSTESNKINKKSSFCSLQCIELSPNNLHQIPLKSVKK